jgi:hypothetical protein
MHHSRRKLAVNCRRLTVLAAAVAAVLSLAVRVTPARASGISTATATYQLTSDVNLPAADSSASGPQVIAAVSGGTVVPPTQSDGTQGSPLTILSSSAGLDQNKLIVALKNQVSNGSTPAQQLFGLSFLGSGLQSAANGGHLDFQLSVDGSQLVPTLSVTNNNALHVAALTLPTPTTTVTTPPVTTPTTPTVTPTTTATDSSQVQVPEPTALVLWSAVAGAGLLRARGLRRRQVA